MFQTFTHEHVELNSHDLVLHVRPVSIFHDGSDDSVRGVPILQGRQRKARGLFYETLFGKSHAQRSF